MSFLVALGFSLGLPFSSIDSTDVPPEVPLGKGVFLMANPAMRDPHFFHSVILLMNYGEGGAWGLMLNKPTNYTPKEAISDLKGIDKLSHPLFRGGPVQQDRISILLYRDNPPDGAQRILDDVFLSLNKQTLSKALEEKTPDKKIRLYTGYTGWSPGQLEREIASGAWRILRPDARMIFAEDPSKIWPMLLHRERKWMVILPYSHHDLL